MPQLLPQLIISLVIGLVTAAIKAAIAFGSRALQNKKKRKRIDNKAKENKENVTETTADLPVIYGRARVGCSRVFISQQLAYAGEETFEDNGVQITQSTRGEYLYLISAFCTGEIDDIEQIYLDNVAITNSKYSNGYKNNIRFDWSFVEPSPVTITTIVREVKTGGQRGFIEGGWQWTGSQWIRYVPVQSQPTRYFLYEIRNNQKYLIISFTGGTQSAGLNNVGYGNKEYQLEYLKDSGQVIVVGRAVVTLTQDDADFAQSINNNLTVTQNSFLNSEYVYYDEKRGTLTQTASSRFLADGCPNYNEHMRGFKVALAYLRLLIRTKGRAAENAPIQGIPDVQATIRGQLVLDTRTNTLGYSNNPAMCIRDYLLDSLYYGCQIDASTINEQSFKDAADYCDELITASNGVTQIKRYVLNGVVNTSQDTLDNLVEMLEACNGFLYNDFGQWRLVIEKPETSVWSFTVDNIEESTISLNKADYRSKLNTINAKFVNEQTSWETDVVTVTNESFIAQDGGKVLDSELELGFTNDYDHAYYLALLKLKSGRADLRITFSTYWDAFDILPGAVIDITLDNYGFNQKLFRVLEIMPDNETGLLKFTCLEYDADVYNNLNIDPFADNINSDLPSLFDVQAPSNVQVNQTFSYDANNNYVTVTRFSWQPSSSLNVVRYQLELRPISFGDYQVVGTSNGSELTANNIAVGLYDLRLKAINSIGYESEYYEELIEIFAPTQKPANVEGFQVGSSAREFVLRWNTVPEVANNGFYVIRHSRNLNNVNWNDTPTFELRVPGYQTTTTISQMDGTYMIKAMNSAGLMSEAESRLTLDSPIDNEFSLVQTIEESPSFAGEIVQFNEIITDVMQWGVDDILWGAETAQWSQNIGTPSFLISDNKLLLGNQLTIDSIDPALTIDQLEALGLTIDQWGTSTNFLLGVYYFANSIDFGAIYKATFETLFDATTIQNSGATVDELEALNLTIDELEASDYTIDAWNLTNISTARIFIYVRYTRDNPANGAVWTEWQLLTKNEFVCRAAQFKLEVISPDKTTNIEINQLGVKAWMKNRIDQKSTLITTSNQQVTYNQSFYSAPSTINLSIDNPALGDFAQASFIDKDKFIINASNIPRSITATVYGVGERHF